ncbi:ATPase [Perilla frutescens var. hirtella]|nr:ATPase [Perilla frutescens var. hirtella]
MGFLVTTLIFVVVGVTSDIGYYSDSLLLDDRRVERTFTEDVHMTGKAFGRKVSGSVY